MQSPRRSLWVFVVVPMLLASGGCRTLARWQAKKQESESAASSIQDEAAEAPGTVPPNRGGDNDGDSLENIIDQCPDDPEDADGFNDADGCPDIDNDTDGITDAADKCPSEPEDMDGFSDDDGCPDPDNDADGTADAADQCPNTPGPQQGCP